VVVADADDLDRPIQQAVVTGHDRRLELDGRGLPRRVRRAGIGDVPLGLTVDPREQPVRADRVDDRRCAKITPRSYSSSIAAIARAVSDLLLVTRVPSTSARTAAIGWVTGSEA